LNAITVETAIEALEVAPDNREGDCCVKVMGTCANVGANIPTTEIRRTILFFAMTVTKWVSLAKSDED
jgi:hypothetical protein